MTEYAVGIDLGMTNSRVAVFRNNHVEIIENEHGYRATPSWVTFTNDFVLTGNEARDESHLAFKAAVFEVKRLIGQKFNDPNVQEDIKRLPYTIVNDLDVPKIIIKLNNGIENEYYPEEISAFILKKMKTIAEARLNTTVRRAVITVPAYYNDIQKQAIKDAGTIVGFKCVNLISEPIAAVLAFHHHKKDYKRTIMVYDFGRSTFDVSIVLIGRAGCIVKSTKSDSHLGGVDIDENLVNFIKQDFKLQYGKYISNDDLIYGRLNSVCKMAKKRLTKSFQTKIELDSLSGENYSIRLPRLRLEQLIEEPLQKTLQLIDDCLNEARLKKEEIDEVILIGGSTKIPKIQKMLKNYFGKEILNQGINPEEAIAYGAAIYASKSTGDKIEVSDV